MTPKVKWILIGLNALVLLGLLVAYHIKTVEGEVAKAQSALLKTAGEAALVREQEAKSQLAPLTQRVAQLEAVLVQHPIPPKARPVPINATAQEVASGFTELGLKPIVQLGDYPLGFLLADGRTALGWGREALRVPGLEARGAALEDLHAADVAVLSKTSEALSAADARAEAETRRADASDKALAKAPLDKPWSVGLLTGYDTTGARKFGAFATGAYGPIQGQVMILGNSAAIGAGFRFGKPIF